MRPLLPKKFLFGAAVGTGMTALAAERGGADFLIILNAGRLRLRGASSLTCYLPLRDCNDWVGEIADKEILHRCESPVFMGAYAGDPRKSTDQMIEEATQAGFSGIVNFPSSWAIDGRLRHALEQEGIGFARECELIGKAAKKGLMTLAYVNNSVEAQRMADAGAQSLCMVAGFTGGATGVETNLSLEAVAEIVDQTFRSIPPTVRRLVEGGPIATPEDALAVSRLCQVEGYIAGSTIDRLPLEETIERVVKSYKVINQLNEQGRPAKAEDQSSDKQGLDGQAPDIAKARDMAEKAAQNQFPLLICGETGTGKERLAQFAHASGPNRARKMVVLNCSSMSGENSASLLFGEESGFSGRGSAARRGLLEEAHNSTLFLDEICDLDISMQALLLRFLERRETSRLGSQQVQQLDCHIIACTNQDLSAHIKKGLFRQDLYYRLAGFELTLPALRDRLEDLPILARRLLDAHYPAGSITLSNSAFSLLLAQEWPGNIRQLRNALLRAAMSCDQTLLRARDFAFLREREHNNPQGAFDHIEDADPDQTAQALPQTTAKSGLEDALSEKDWIAMALRRNRYRKAETAAELGLTTRTLYNKIKKYQLY